MSIHVEIIQMLHDRKQQAIQQLRHYETDAASIVSGIKTRLVELDQELIAAAHRVMESGKHLAGYETSEFMPDEAKALLAKNEPKTPVAELVDARVANSDTPAA